MSRVVLMMDHRENRRLLADWLATRYAVSPNGTDGAVEEDYDLALLDGPALARLEDRIAARRKAEEPVFLPFLLVTSQQEVGLATRQLWRSIDEIIHGPIDRLELQARLEVLLRVRRQSADLRKSAEAALRDAEESLRRQNERLRLLWDAASVLLSTGDPDAMLRSLFDRIGPHFGLDAYLNFLVNDAGDALRLASWAGVPEAGARTVERLAFGEAICGTVAADRRPVVATDIQNSDDPQAGLVRSLGVRAYACHPLMAGDRLIGTLSFASRSRDQFDADELGFLRTVCQYVAFAYERLGLVRQLRDADARKDEFLATLAHELRNPLAPVRTGLEVLKLAGDDRELAEETRSTMEQQLGQMVRLIDDLLEISRITRGKLQLRRERTELSSAVRSAVDATRPLMQESAHTLKVSLPSGTIPLDADPARLAQVFSNLLGNAAKYTEPGGNIRLTAERQGSDVVVAVRDTGIGIPAEHLPKLFEMFSQVDSALERSQGGLGIGLSLVRGLVEMHGGSVEAHSEGPGKGSEFVVRLPVLIEPAPEPQPVGDGGPAASGTLRILVVEDNKAAAKMLAMLLGALGNEVRTAFDGAQGVETAGEFRPDVVLMDIGMPKLNGYEAARRIREQPWGRDVILVALTGWGQEEDRQRTKEAGFDHHLVKPVEPAALRKLLAECVPLPK